MQLVQKPEFTMSSSCPTCTAMLYPTWQQVSLRVWRRTGANLGEEYAVFEPVHEAPKIQRLNKVNLLIDISGVMTPDILESSCSDRLNSGIRSAEGKHDAI
jgi:hypothetical protein